MYNNDNKLPLRADRTRALSRFHGAADPLESRPVTFYPPTPMKTLTACLFITIVALCPRARADEPAIVTKARAYLGSESALNAATSVRMTGSMATVDPAGKPMQIAVDIVFQKPFQESITVLQANRVVHTSLDGYDASQQSQDGVPNQKEIDYKNKPWRLTVLGGDQVKTLRVDVLENLFFYRGVLRVGGQIEDRGPATADGKTTEKVAFIYAPNFVYIRHFDPDTGRLVYTESESGTQIREQGEIMAGGIRFPKVIEVTENLNGTPSKKTYTFDKVTVNETYPDSLFAIPALSGATSAAAPVAPAPAPAPSAAPAVALPATH